jgi:hypothetical protein
MALPTRNDPMLSYLTTGFQDHVRLREKFGFKVNDDMWDFFKKIKVIDANGKPTKHFGDPVWVAKGDTRYFSAGARRPPGHRLPNIWGQRRQGQNAFSAYITKTGRGTWGKEGGVDHDITKVVSGISVTGLEPKKGAETTVKLIESM